MSEPTAPPPHDASSALDLSYLDAPLHDATGLRPEVDARARAVALRWVEEGVDPAVLEVLSELLARTAAELGEEHATVEVLGDAVGFLELPLPVDAWLRRAVGEGLGATALAALAVHTLDVAEAAALQVFGPELPRLATKSERTGDAARRVGAARHLRG